MKRLILMRHAKTEPFNMSGTTDLKRNLIEKGIEDSKMMGKFLKKENIIPDFIISSHSERTKQTLDLVLKELDKKIKLKFDEVIYENEEKKIINLITKVECNVNTLMIVGHNPSIETMVSIFTGKLFPIDQFKPGAVAVLDFSIKEWDEIKETFGNLSYFETPKMLM